VGAARGGWGGFQSEQDAGEALERALERLRRANGTGTTLTLAGLVDVYLAQHDAQPETIEKLRWLLAKAVGEFGDRRLGELRSQEIAAWRMTIPPGHRFEATQALRQVLARAVAWGMIDVNPAQRGVDNPQRRRTEKRPFESWAQLAAVASRLGECSGALVMLAAATGLRPGEWIALERRDIDPAARVVYVRRAYRNGRLKCTKTEGSVRAVPLQEIALDASPDSRRVLTPTFCSRPFAAPTSICTISARASGSPPNSLSESHRSDASTICATLSRPSRSVPASQPSISPATWAPA
jgi:integrase